ncbi:unnamed protein product [Allacma fusca]|uniref:Uncharacterized protein n=1 Tax=Allacma fusca TaxID=39272 RepID=A0A8J2KK22_9HEXA|nr:unnamed protein product [Allacma fusca]
MNSGYENLDSRSDAFSPYDHCLRRRNSPPLCFPNENNPSTFGVDNNREVSNNNCFGSRIGRERQMQHSQGLYDHGGEDVENMLEDPRGVPQYTDQMDHNELPACAFAGVSDRVDMSTRSGHGQGHSDSGMQYQGGVAGNNVAVVLPSQFTPFVISIPPIILISSVSSFNSGPSHGTYVIN